MKYRYNTIVIFLNWTTAFAVSFLILCILYHISHSLNFFRRGLVSVIALEIFMIVGFNKEYQERYIEFKDEIVVFNSFRIASKVRTFNVKYEDIIRLHAKSLPILGIYAIVIKAKNIPWDIKVTWRMNKHKELFSTLCRKAFETKEVEFIDSNLITFLEKQYEKKTK